MDVKALETEAVSAISGASTLMELEAARVRYLGRKSELSRALRDVRDRETGMVLNPVRERLERAVEDRRKQLERAELDRRLGEEAVDVTLPGLQQQVCTLHPPTHIPRRSADAERAVEADY
jgi:phenylalanyl-tRNA synthetase alpha chain